MYAMTRHPLQFNSHLFLCDIRSKWSEDDALSYLDELEKNRYESFKVSEAGRRFLAARYFLKTVLAAELSCPPTSISFSYTSLGKPYLPQAPHLHFNMSHAQDLIAIVVSPYQVGVDIEFQRPVHSMDAVAARVFSLQDQTQLNDAPPPNKSTQFFELWTKKEATTKASGKGIFTIPVETPNQGVYSITEILPGGYYGAVCWVNGELNYGESAGISSPNNR
jgi:phosphopantetheinyl transferase